MQGIAQRPAVYDFQQRLDVQGIEEAGTRLAQVLTKKDSIAKMKASMAPEVAKSLARVSGGLYVITAANKSARGAMLASWVAQASSAVLLMGTCRNAAQPKPRQPVHRCMHLIAANDVTCIVVIAIATT